MALINRISRLFKADFNAVLDRIEEPEQLLRQAIRDMEDDLAQSQRRIAACTQEQENLRDRRQEVLDSTAGFDTQLDLCFESGKDDLAKGIVRRKLEAERLLQRLDGRLTANARFLDRQRKLLEENRATLDSLRQKSELIVADARADGTFPGTDDVGGAGQELRIGDDEVEIAFLREQAARSRS
jgi:phage shock protein A